MDHNYAEPDSDDANMEEDSEEDSDEMQQGYLCTSTDPRRIGTGDGETIILNSRELRKAISLQQNAKDQTIWMTTAHAGFPLERDEVEVTNSKDTQMGRITTRYLHATISTFIANWETDLTSTGKNSSPLEQAVIDLENKWSQKYVTGTRECPTQPSPTVAVFHQLLYIKKDIQEECWGSKMKGWW